MKIGGEYKLTHIGLRHWQKFAREMRIEPDELVESLLSMAKRIPDEVNDARARVRDEGLKEAIIDRLSAQLVTRARECQRILEGVSA